MDYANLADLTRHDSWQQFQQARQPGRLILLTTKADCDLWAFDFKADDTLMLGRESAGVPDAVHDGCDHHLRIAMPGGGRSLNVSVAAGIALGEALRQTRRGDSDA